MVESLVQEAFNKGLETAEVIPGRQSIEELQKQFGVEVRDAKIMVFGCGGAGNNSINRLSEMGICGASTVAINTDAKHLNVIKADKRILIGKELTRGMGAGGYPEIGAKAALESAREIKKELEGMDMVYLVTGLGGGTGTGAAPVVAKMARDMGAITIGCVTMPFRIEGARMRKAEDGLSKLRQFCDTVIVIENDRLLKVAGDLPLQQAFGVADNLVSTIIKGVTETISTPSLVNLDYADVKTIMHSGGVAACGFGEANTSNRAEEAVIKALTNPLLEVDYNGATGALIHITGGSDLRLEEVNLIGEYVSRHLDSEAQVIWGARLDPAFDGKVRVITIVTGVKSPWMTDNVEIAQAPLKAMEMSKRLGIPMYA